MSRKPQQSTRSRSVLVSVLACALGAMLCVVVAATAAQAETDGGPSLGPVPERVGPDLITPDLTPPDVAPDALPGIAPERDMFGRRWIGPEEFRAAFEGKTVHLSAQGQHYGSEFYLPNDRSLWIGGDGPCRRGRWAYDGPDICFRYGDDGPYCWGVFEQDGIYYAESRDGLVLRIYAVEERPLSCDPELFS